MTCGIYKIVHTKSGFAYVGQSVNIEKRRPIHAGAYGQTRIARAIRKHGWDEFTFEVLEACDQAALDDRERHWISVIDCVSPRGFNLNGGGKAFQSISEEMRANISAALKGKRKSEAHRKAIGDALRGKAQKPEFVAARAELRVGTKRPLDAVAKTAEKCRGRKRPASAVEATRLGLLGRSQTAEHIANMLAGKERAKAERAAKTTALQTAIGGVQLK